jgi:uncharacterized protein YceK
VAEVGGGGESRFALTSFRDIRPNSLFLLSLSLSGVVWGCGTISIKEESKEDLNDAFLEVEVADGASKSGFILFIRRRMMMILSGCVKVVYHTTPKKPKRVYHEITPTTTAIN